jgi:hypothetical protein
MAEKLFDVYVIEPFYLPNSNPLGPILFAKNLLFSKFLK